jgi:hypothetical protein
MPTDAELDDVPNRAVQYAVGALAGNFAPLSRLQCIVVACVAVNREMLRIDKTLSKSAVALRLGAVGHAALLEEIRAMRISGISRSDLAGGIERLPHQQRLIFALRHQADMKDPEIAAVLGITMQDLKAADALAFDQLWSERP